MLVENFWKFFPVTWYLFLFPLSAPWSLHRAKGMRRQQQRALNHVWKTGITFSVAYGGMLAHWLHSRGKTYCTVHCTENQIYVFPEMKLRGIVPDSYIHVSVSDRIGLPIWLQQNRQTDPGNILYKLLTDTCTLYFRLIFLIYVFYYIFVKTVAG
jgi:hypothetical protein